MKCYHRKANLNIIQRFDLLIVGMKRITLLRLVAVIMQLIHSETAATDRLLHTEHKLFLLVTCITVIRKFYSSLGTPSPATVCPQNTIEKTVSRPLWSGVEIRIAPRWDVAPNAFLKERCGQLGSLYLMKKDKLTQS